MKRLSIVLVAVIGVFTCGQAIPAGQNTQWEETVMIDYLTAWQVMWMYDQEKLAMDLNRVFHDDWNEPEFASLAALNRRHMDELLDMINHYELYRLTESNEVGVYGSERHTEAFLDLQTRGAESLLEAYRAAANPGDACQRWLIAQGDYTGDRAELDVFSTSGGRFDLGDPTPTVTPVGSLELIFESCLHGMILYDLPSINRQGSIPIQRVAMDIVAQCELGQ